MRVLVLSFLMSYSLVTAAAGEVAMRTEPVTVATAAGVTQFSAEIADTAALRERGLMFRKSLAPDRAMLFDFGKPRPVAMWMKDTFISLDMVFIRADGTVAGLATDTVPHSLDVVGIKEPVLAVLEVAAGTAQRIGLKPGDRVRHPMFKPAE